jgi:hypothetical protein
LAVSEGVLSQQHSCWERKAVGEAPVRPNGAGAVRFANSFTIRCWQREQPFTTVGEADGTDTVWPRRGFANSLSFPTGMLLGKNPFANSRTLPSVLGFWAVGEDFFTDNRVFLSGKIFFANSLGLG